MILHNYNSVIISIHVYIRVLFPGLRYWPYAGYKHPGTLHITFGLYSAYKSYIYCFVRSCADIWSIKISNHIFFLDISLIFHVSVKHWLCIHLHVALPTLTCFIIDYHVDNDTPFLLFRCVQPSKYL